MKTRVTVRNSCSHAPSECAKFAVGGEQWHFQ